MNEKGMTQRYAKKKDAKTTIGERRKKDKK